MKYMLMMFGDAGDMMKTASPEWIEEMMGFMDQLNSELVESGELVVGEGLADSDQAKTVRFQNGTAVATDGPYAESKESIIGFWILDVADEARMMEIAARVVKYALVAEIRPVGIAPEL